MLKPPHALPGSINYSFVDRFTLVHFCIGSLYGLLGTSFVFVLLLAIGWELVENPLKVLFPKVFPEASADTLQNSIGDTLAVLSGWWVSLSIVLAKSS
ncbi:MAG: hypothetical protein R3A80_09865 [Bdellovibrionota bacterium]